MDEPTLDALYAGLGIDPAAESEDPNPETEEEPESGASGTEPQEPDPNADEGTESEESEQPAQQQQNSKDTKAQQAFIYLRQQNQKYNSMLKNIAAMLEIDPKSISDDNALLSALQEKVNANTAKAQNVPVELINRLQQLEERDREYSLRVRQGAVEGAFRNVQNQFNLTNEQLMQFSEDLIKAGKNPVTMDIDMIAEYRNMHFEELINNAVAKAVADEQARAAKAAGQSTTPDQTRGKSSGDDGDKITNTQQLTEWMRSTLGQK